MQEIASDLTGEPARKKGKYLSARSINNRIKSPTLFKSGKIQNNEKVARSRREQTYQAAIEIHGGGSTNQSAEVGLIDTTLAKCGKKILGEVLSCSNKFNKNVVPQLYHGPLKHFEASDENMIRSVSVYYDGGIMGKRKYRQVYRNISFQKSKNDKKKHRKRLNVNGCPIPLLVPYNKLMPFIKSIDIGTVHNTGDLCSDLEDSDKVHGCYRGLKELLIMLAQFYLTHRPDELVWFDEPNKFYVALGGDGAPFGKYDTACAWLVSILNLGKGVLSSHDNYLLFGANCSESCVTVSKFIQKLVVEVGQIEKEVFPITVKDSVVNVKFCVSELPNDMKMLAYLAGELSNSAKYFSTFADVSLENCKNINGSFGKEKSNTWHPWQYSKRLAVVTKVDAQKELLGKKTIKPATKRHRITKCMADTESPGVCALSWQTY